MRSLLGNRVDEAAGTEPTSSTVPPVATEKRATPRSAEGTQSRVPMVNLLSPRSFEALATRRLRGRFLAAGCALVLLMAVAWGVQHVRIEQARDVLAVEETEGARLTAETQALAPVRTFVNAVNQQRQIVSDTMQGEILFSRVLRSLRAAAPAAAHIESVTVTLTPAGSGSVPATGTTAPPGTSVAESACPGPDPFKTRVVVGCVQLSGSAAGRAAVGDLVIALSDVGLFVEPFISATTTTDGDAVAFSGSVGLSPQVFSKRYVALDAQGRRGDVR